MRVWVLTLGVGACGAGCGGEAITQAADPCEEEGPLGSSAAIAAHMCAETLEGAEPGGIDLTGAALIRVSGEGVGQAAASGKLEKWTIDWFKDSVVYRVEIDGDERTIAPSSAASMEVCTEPPVEAPSTGSFIPAAAAMLGVSSSASVHVWFNQANGCSFYDTGGNPRVTFATSETASTYHHAESSGGHLSTCSDCVSFDPEGCCTGL